MERFLTAQGILIVKTFCQKGERATQVVQKLRTIFGRNQAPCESAVRRLVTKFETTGLVLTVKLPEREHFCQTEEQIVLVQNSVIASPRKSIRRRSQELDIPTSSLHLILHKKLQMHTYKIQFTQNLKPADHGRRRRFAD